MVGITSSKIHDILLLTMTVFVTNCCIGKNCWAQFTADSDQSARIVATGMQYTTENSLHTSPSRNTVISEQSNTTRINSDGTKFDPLWVKIMNVAQAICSLIGFVSNLVTLLTLMRSNIGLGSAVCLLLRHQSTVDMVICLLAALLIIPPPMWTSGNDIFDEILCHAWHGQALYWQWYTASVYSLVLIAIERFLCVRKPMLYPTLMSKKRLYYSIAAIQIWAFFLLIPSYMQTRFSEGQCLSEYPIPGKGYAFFQSIYGIIIFIFFYSVPMLLFIICYGFVIVTLRNRMSGDSAMPESRVIKKASQELTKCAVTVTLIFILSTSFELWYYLLGKTQVVPYVINSAIQKTAVFMSIINVSANPIVYAVMMPVYRKKVTDTLLCQKRDSTKKQENNKTLTVSTDEKN